MRSFRVVLSLLACLLSGAGTNAFADTVSINVTSTPSLAPSADTLVLHAKTSTFTLGTPFLLQPGTYTVGDSGMLARVFPFSVTENVILDGDTETFTLTGQNFVSNTTTTNTDVLTIFGQTIFFPGPNLTLQIQQYVSPAMTVGGVSAITLTGVASVAPEPSSFALLGTGLLGVAGMVRRRFA